VKRKRHSELRRQFDRALKAANNREWWDGKRWRPNGEFPRTPTEGKAYKTPHEVMEETNRAMIGDGPVNSAASVRAAHRFARSHEADLERSGHTEQEADAHVIFEAAKPLLQKYPGRLPWTTLALKLQGQLHATLHNPEITAGRLRMICRHREK
jgi:hypothetical protein